MKKQLFFDARAIADPPHGISRVAHEFAKHWLRRSDWQITFLVQAGSPLLHDPLFAEQRFQVLNSSPYGLRSQWEVGALLKRQKPDLYFTPTFAAPRWQSCPVVMMIHDVIHLRYSQDYSRFHPVYYRHVVRPAAMHAAAVLTVSDFSRRELVEVLQIQPEKIHTIYNGVDEAFHPDTPLNSALNLPERFVLYVGNQKSHKRVDLLLRLYARFCREYPNPPALVITGKPEVHIQKLQDELDFGEQGSIHWLDSVPDASLPMLYASAIALVYPSAYEGFGLPVLEAMACGTAVIAYRVASLPEVVGEAGILVDPQDEWNLMIALQDLLDNPIIASHLKKSGPRQAARFRWDHAAEQAAKVIEQVLEQNDALIRLHQK